MNIRQARNKIKSVGSVKKITRAMQLVSAIKMKKAQERAVEGKPYQTHLDLILKKVVRKIDPRYSVLLMPKEGAKKKDLAIVIASNKGLCGGFNMNLFRFILKNTDFHTTDFAIVGKKAAVLKRLGGNILADYSSGLPAENISALFGFALSRFLDDTYGHVYLFYNSFISTSKVEPIKDILLPVHLAIETQPKDEKTEIDTEYLIEPNPEEIIDALLRSFVQEKIQFAMIQSEAGEHSSRMMAMKNATDNATDVIYNLTLLRNKLRQEKITNELLDMVTAKESVESS